MKKTMVVLAGPTAIGKTISGIKLARYFGTEIISADSRQIYRETSIGTAVPSREELLAVKHHFIQTVSVRENYNASKYEQDVLKCVTNLFNRHDLLLMVGGSGLYINAVCHGIDDLPSVDPDLRAQLLERYNMEGLDRLTDELKKLDPASHGRIDLKNHMRVLKALEVSIQTGRPYSSFLSASGKKRGFRILRAALDMDRELLYQRINLRVDEMMKSGLLKEAELLADLRGYNAMKTVGYRELYRYLDGDISIDEAVDQIKRNSRKYARKQLTWFRKDNLYTWFSPGDEREIISWIEKELMIHNR